MLILTKKDFDYAYENDVFEGIDDAILKSYYDRVLDIDQKDENEQISNPILRGLYNNESFRLYISCNDINVKYGFNDSPFHKNGSYSSLNDDHGDMDKEKANRDNFTTLNNYLLNKKLITTDIKDPYFYFEIVHDNLNILYETINAIINIESTQKQFSIWVGTEKMRAIELGGPSVSRISEADSVP